MFVYVYGLPSDPYLFYNYITLLRNQSFWNHTI